MLRRCSGRPTVTARVPDGDTGITLSRQRAHAVRDRQPAFRPAHS
jgi:hypothetical protein